jgi:hypothetical protein
LKITLLLYTLLPAHPIFWDDALGLGLKTFLTLELPNIAQASRLAPPAVQTRCLLRVPALVGRVRAGWGLDFHLDDAVRVEIFHHIVATLASSWNRGPDEGGDEKSQGRRLAQAIQVSGRKEFVGNEGRLQAGSRDVISGDPAFRCGLCLPAPHETKFSRFHFHQS